jgi:hypothetical protein
MMPKEEYLGDGLYASFDGFMFMLRAPRSGGDHWVGLEPAVLRNFDEYRKRAIKEMQNERNHKDTK